VAGWAERRNPTQKGRTVTDAEAVIAVLQLAAGDASEQEFIDWVRANTRVPNE
jgi:hypothetical protein